MGGSPEGYPQTPPYKWWKWHDNYDSHRVAHLGAGVARGRPIAHWPRFDSGRSDDLRDGKR